MDSTDKCVGEWVETSFDWEQFLPPQTDLELVVGHPRNSGYGPRTSSNSGVEDLRGFILFCFLSLSSSSFVGGFFT